MAVGKIVTGGFLIYKQGKLTLDVFKPIVKVFDSHDRN